MTEDHTCPGIDWLTGEVVLFTGRAYVNGKHIPRNTLKAFARAMGARPSSDPTQNVTVLVHGETWSGPLHDEQRRYSQKAAFVEEVERRTGRHVHVIDAQDFGKLSKHERVRCYRLVPPA